MEDIDKKFQKRFNIFNDDKNEKKEEKELNRINLRKKKIQNIMMCKRYFDNYSNIDNNLNHKNNINNNNSQKKENEYMIDISSFLIKEELKKKETIDSILSEQNFNTIFDYINEIYKENNFQIDILKYGLFLLNQKLLNCTDIENEEDKNKIIDDIIKFNLEDIIIKLLNFSMNEIKNKDNNDIILNLAYQILVNYAYLGNEKQLLFLINDNLIKFHLFFLKYSSNEQILINIMRMIFNICTDNESITNKLFDYNNY